MNRSPIEYFALNLPVIGIIYAVYTIVTLHFNKENWEVSDLDPESVKSLRSTNRGQYISLVVSLTAILQGFLLSKGANEATLLTTFGFIYAAVLGFIGDKMIGTDDGYAYIHGSRGTSNLGRCHAFKYGISSLATADFARYIITVMLDMFISSPIQELIGHLTRSTSTKLVKNSKNGSYENIIGQNFGNIVQSVVAIITFNAYTNSTRFKWAYPPKTAMPNDKIPASTIQLATSIAAVVYLVSSMPKDKAPPSLLNQATNTASKVVDTVTDTVTGTGNTLSKFANNALKTVKKQSGGVILAGEPLNDTLATKMSYVIITIMILMGLSMTGTDTATSKYDIINTIEVDNSMSEDPEDPEDLDYDENGIPRIVISIKENEIPDRFEISERWWMGLVVFVIISYIGFILPTQKGKTDTIKWGRLLCGASIMSAVIPIALTEMDDIYSVVKSVKKNVRSVNPITIGSNIVDGVGYGVTLGGNVGRGITLGGNVGRGIGRGVGRGIDNISNLDMPSISVNVS